MKSELLKMLRRRLLTGLAVFGLGAALIGGSYAAVGSVGKSHPTKGSAVVSAESASPEVSESETPEVTESETPEAEESGVHGGTVARFQDAAACPLPEGVELTGNWTHGDYVAAVVAAKGDAKTAKAAAQSDCGKPMSSIHSDSDVHGQSAEEHGKSGMEHGKSASHKPGTADSP